MVVSENHCSWPSLAENVARRKGGGLQLATEMACDAAMSSKSV
jgi:hypothetical protein